MISEEARRAFLQFNEVLWSWSKIAITPSPMNLSIRPWFSVTASVTNLKYLFNMNTTSNGILPSDKVVKPRRSQNMITVSFSWPDKCSWLSNRSFCFSFLTREISGLISIFFSGLSWQANLILGSKPNLSITRCSILFGVGSSSRFEITLTRQVVHLPLPPHTDSW